MTGSRLLLNVLTSVIVFHAASARGQAPATTAAPYCVGGYADDLSALASQYRDRQPSGFSYCVRNTAVYECLSYGPDGEIRRRRRRTILHGTAFAYRQQSGDTLLLTNDHVASWPTVTS